MYTRLTTRIPAFLGIARRHYHITPIGAFPHPGPIVKELALDVVQKPQFGLGIHGYWLAFLRAQALVPRVSHLRNKNPTLGDSLRATTELNALDLHTREALISMWSTSTTITVEELMKNQFTTHGVLSTNGDYNIGYFQETFDVAAKYIGGSKDIRSFLRENFGPRMKYPAPVVNAELDNFVGAKVRMTLGNSNPPILQRVGLLHENEVLIDHPDSHQYRDDMIVRTRE